jgi:uncharacterized protein (DUF4415 family)
MAITRPKKPLDPDASAEAFVKGAPDAARKGVKKGKKEQITITIAPDLLEKVDEHATQRGQSRAATINLAIWEFVSRGGVAN